MANRAAQKQNNRAQIQALEDALKQKDAKIAELEQRLDRLTELLVNAQRARFGQSSEKQKYVMKNAKQMSFFNEAETEQNPKAPEPTEESVTVAMHQRRKKAKRTYNELLEALPEEEVFLDLSEEQKNCPKCGMQLKRIGKKYVKSELILIPETVKILRYYTYTYACPSCEKDTGYATIRCAAAPPSLMKHSLASPSTVADVMVKKYADGLPLARQEKIWKRHGLELSRATLANWVIQTTQNWLKPLYRQLKKHLLEQNVIHADETVVQVHGEEGKPATSESRMWVYASGKRCSKQIRCFEYQPDRSGDRAKTFLKGFKGCLVTDGYSGYNKVEGVIRCGCWAHMKRKWREAMPDGATVKNSKSAVGYSYCNRIFAWEKKCEDFSNEQRKEFRKLKLEPLVEEYYLWLNTVNPEEGSKLEEAVTYARNQKASLYTFLDYGEVDISNNLAENAIRPFVVGRKNWLFCDSVKGADSSAIVYTLVETAKANGLDPYDYLLRILTWLPCFGKTPAAEKLETLMPWHPNMQALNETADI